jgi:hypothetical protein
MDNTGQKNYKVQTYLESKSKVIHGELIRELDIKELDLDKLRGIISLYPDSTKENIKKIISNYKLPEKILKGDVKDNKYNTTLNETDFCNLVTGKELKNVLFEKNIDGKKDNIESLFTLYELMGGNSEGISKDKLSNCLSKAFSLYKNAQGYMEENFNPDNVTTKYTSEVQEILDLLGDGDKLTLKEFVNIMSSDYVTDFENLHINGLD